MIHYLKTFDVLKDFYTIIHKVSGQNIEYRIKLNPSHEIFEGHFPGQPVTPGVVLIQITSELTKNAIAQNVKLKQIINSKFLNVLNPEKNSEVTFKINITKEDQTHKVVTSADDEGVCFFKMTAIYQ